jgi:L-ascorbate metabolism protein UlaG (beta-lactamase superfamily)
VTEAAHGVIAEPVLADDAFLADVDAHRGDRDGFSLWWLGQSGFLVQWGGHHALLDPYLSESLTKKYATTDKPHVRMTRRVLAPERLAFAGIVSSSHNHTDHLDGETLRPLLQASPALRILVPAANRAFAADRLGCETGRLDIIDDGQTVACGPFAVDVALLPINGRKPERRVPGNMWGREAAALALRMNARYLIPHHFDMFAFNTATPAELTDECARLGVPVRVLRNGERFGSGDLPPRSRVT